MPPSEGDRDAGMAFTRGTIVLRARAFPAATRAGATSITAVLLTVGTVAAAALATDHLWLVDQRDILETAADAASVAATLEMHRQRADQPGIGKDKLKTALVEVAKRYVLVNLAHLPPDRLERAKETLEVEAVPDTEQGTIKVKAEADLGGTLFSRHLPLLGRYAGPEKMVADAAVECATDVVEVVLAIDVTDSMTNSFGGARRIDAAIEAASALTEVLYSGCADADIAVGVVPWDRTVRLDASRALVWARDGWADVSRYDSAPGVGRGDWDGCLEDRTHAVGDPKTSHGLSLALPGTEAIPAYFHPDTATLDARIINDAYAKLATALPQAVVDLGETAIRDELRRAGDNHWGAPLRGFPHEVAGPNAKCTKIAMLPLTAGQEQVKRHLTELQTLGNRDLWHGGTMGHVGVTWARRMLAASWRPVWGDPVHPVDPAARQVTKALVLLTDGQNSAGDRSDSLPGLLHATYDAQASELELRCRRKAAGCKVLRIGYASNYSAIGRFGAGVAEDGFRMAWARAKKQEGVARDALNALMHDACALARDVEGLSVYTVSMSDNETWNQKLLACSGTAQTTTDDARSDFHFSGSDPESIKRVFRDIGKQLVAVRRTN